MADGACRTLLTILVRGILMMALGSPAGGLALLVVSKTALDVCGHVWERKKLALAVADVRI
jgi:hypothetical protein